MNKALMILINDGVVKVPHLLQSTVEDGKPVPWVQPHEPPAVAISIPAIEIAKDLACTAWLATAAATASRTNISASAGQNRGPSQVPLRCSAQGQRNP